MKPFTLILLLFACHAGHAQNADSLNVAPNPFVSATNIYYGLANNDTVSLSVYNMFGQTVKTFMQDSLMNSGYYSILFAADSLVDGIYLVRLGLGVHKTIVKLAIKSQTAAVVENASLTGTVFYPNPTNDLLTISINGVKNIFVTSPGGKICKRMHTRENTISLGDLKPGGYIITVFSDDNTLQATGKVVKF